MNGRPPTIVVSPAAADSFRAVRDEVVRTTLSYGDFSSMHEAYGVLAEEVSELFNAVCLKQDVVGSGRSKRADLIRAEAIQIAAVAIRIAEQAGRVTR